MYVFTPNTLIESAKVNANNTELSNRITALENRAIINLCFSTSPVTINYAVAWSFYKVALDKIGSEYDPAGQLSLSNNGVLIGSGVSIVRVSGVFAWYNNGGENDYITQIYKNSSGQGSASYWNAPVTTDYITSPVAPCILSVAKDDVIYLYSAHGATGNRSLFGLTTLTVEVIK